MRGMTLLAALAIFAGGCAKESNEYPASDARSTDATMQGGGMAGHGDSAAMSGGMMISGDMKKDMAMMNDMMVRDLGPGDALYDHRFIDMMIPHHEGAIAMAKDAQQKANRPELKKLAESIITAQQAEIDQMKAWRTAWYGANTPSGAANADEMKKHMAMMNDEMVKHLGQKDAAYEDRFIHLMTPHHEGAIRMAEDALTKAGHPEIKKLAQSIIDAQRQEIAQFGRWHDQWHGH